MAGIDRRGVLTGMAAASWARAGLAAAAADLPERAGAPLPPWREGTLEIHHLSTGRGDCTLVIGPDGTGLMIDAGASDDGLDVSVPPRPNASRRPGEWIARYARRRLPGPGLDYFVASHLHPDHIGAVAADSPLSPRGGYRLTGVTDVAEGLPIEAVFDRGWPDYAYPEPQTADFATNYIAYMRARAALGLRNGRIEPGRADQLVLAHQPRRYPGFEVRALARDGRVWSGRGDGAIETFPPLAGLAKADRPTENMCSVALRIAYGGFRYFGGGDLTADTYDGVLPWADIEGAAARACGPVDVAAACHHAYYDAVGPVTVAALRPRVWVVPAWHVSHPDMKPLERMLSRRLYPGPRDLFLTQATPESLKVNARFLSQAKSVLGHVIVRVEASGAYRVVVTDSADEDDRVLAAFGPYSSAIKAANAAA
jgi:hypothetical protein